MCDGAPTERQRSLRATELSIPGGESTISLKPIANHMANMLANSHRGQQR